MPEINMPEFLFEIQDLRKGSRLFIEKIEIPRNCLSLISGRTGCGKSTLVSILGLLQKADDSNRGLIEMTPEPGEKLNYRDLYRSRSRMEQVRKAYFGFVFQHDELIDSMTCFENIIFPLLVRESWKSSGLEVLRNAVKKWLADFEFSDLYETLDRSPATLSGGQRQRLALVRGVIHDPPVLIADEPIASVDEKTAYGIVEAIGKYIRQKGKSVIFVIHDKDLSFFKGLRPHLLRLEKA